MPVNNYCPLQIHPNKNLSLPSHECPTLLKRHDVIMACEWFIGHHWNCVIVIMFL